MSSSPELDPNPRRRGCAKTPTCFANAFAQVPWPAPNAAINHCQPPPATCGTSSPLFSFIPFPILLHSPGVCHKWMLCCMTNKAELRVLRRVLQDKEGKKEMVAHLCHISMLCLPVHLPLFAATIQSNVVYLVNNSTGSWKGDSCLTPRLLLTLKWGASKGRSGSSLVGE